MSVKSAKAKATRLLGQIGRLAEEYAQAVKEYDDAKEKEDRVNAAKSDAAVKEALGID
jgi:hypothetical protein